MKLTTASMLLLGGFVVHNADHARRGLAVVDDGVVWGGTLAAMLMAVVWALVLLRHEAAPAVAAVVGWSVAFGVAAVHLLPDWGPLSDSLPDGDVDAWTWIAVFAEIGAAALVGTVALGILRRNQYSPAIIDWR